MDWNDLEQRDKYMQEELYKFLVEEGIFFSYLQYSIPIVEHKFSKYLSINDGDFYFPETGWEETKEGWKYWEHMYLKWSKRKRTIKELFKVE